MSEGDSGPSGTDSSGGSFWTSLPALLTASAVLIGAIVSAVVTLTNDGGGDPVAGSTIPAISTGPDTGRHFAAMTRPLGRVYFEDETMFVKASQPGRPLVVLAEAEAALADVRLGANVAWVSGAKDYGVGFVCRYADAGNYYLLSVLSGGRYHIVRYRRGKPVSLTGGIQANAAVRDAGNDVSASCVGSDPVSLTLAVGGQDIATARDEDGIERGNVGIRLGTSESVVTCAFRGFELRSLQ